MAALSAISGAALWRFVLWRNKPERHLGWPWVLLCVMFPASWLVNVLVKRPIVSALRAGDEGLLLSAAGPWWWFVFRLLLSPITEEAVKLVPLVVPRVRALTRQSGAGWLGLTLGLGYGIGEALYVASGILSSDRYANVPWFLFTGFFGERLLAMVAHAAMTGLAAVGFSRGWRGATAGYSSAVLLHAALNANALLAQLNLEPATVASGVFALQSVACIVLALRLRGSDGDRRLAQDRL